MKKFTFTLAGLLFGSALFAATDETLLPALRLTNLTATQVVASNSSKKLVSVAVTPTELLNVAGVTSTLCGISQSCTLTNKTIDADSNTISNIDNGEIKAAAAIAVNKLAALTASRAVVTDGSGFVSAATTTSTEIGYVNGVTSSLCGINQSCTETNKTFTAPTIDFVNFDDQTTPSNPSAGFYKLYFKSDGKLYKLNSSGTEAEVGATSVAAENSAGTLANCSLATSVGSNALTIALKDSSGSDPSGGSTCSIGFRSSTASTGTYNLRSVTAATSVVVSSGSTLGCANSIACDLYVYALDNSGTVELAVSSTFWTEDNQTTTAEGGAGAADSAVVMYSTTARTSKPVRLLGLITISETTAGTWASNATTIRLAPHLQIEIAPQLWASSTYGSAASCSRTTTSGSLVEPGTDSDCTSRAVIGHGSHVNNEIGKMRVDYIKPGRYTFIGRIPLYVTGSQNSTCEAWYNADGGGAGTNFNYNSATQYSVSINQPAGESGAVEYTWTQTSYAGQHDYYITWRRTQGGGTCTLDNSGAATRATLIYYPLINGS